jgi:hypothetical protein
VAQLDLEQSKSERTSSQLLLFPIFAKPFKKTSSLLKAVELSIRHALLPPPIKRRQNPTGASSVWNRSKCFTIVGDVRMVSDSKGQMETPKSSDDQIA